MKGPERANVWVRMACPPTEMAGRNRLLQRMLAESIRHDPEWLGGHCTAQPRSASFANLFFALGSIAGNQALHFAAPTHAAADKLFDERLAAIFSADANAFLYQSGSSRDCDPAPGLERLCGHLLAINSAGDERNPPELGIWPRKLPRVRDGRLLLTPAILQSAPRPTRCSLPNHDPVCRPELAGAAGRRPSGAPRGLAPGPHQPDQVRELSGAAMRAWSTG